MRGRRRFLALGFIMTALLLIGCGEISPEHPETLATTLPNAQPSPTPVPMPRGPGVEWRLVVISESSGWGLGSAYARQIEKDNGVKVILDDFAIGDLSASAVLKALETGASADPQLVKMPAALMNADVIVLFPSPMVSVDQEAFLSIQSCFGNRVEAPTLCTSDGFERYTADLGSIWAKVFELRAGKPTILRALDYANPFIGRWIEEQVFDTCTGCWQCGSDAIRKAAEAYHILFLSRYDAFNGINHDEDIGQKGYLRGDGIHPNGLAQEYTAELLSKLGYDPVIAP